MLLQGAVCSPALMLHVILQQGPTMQCCTAVLHVACCESLYMCPALDRCLPNIVAAIQRGCCAGACLLVIRPVCGQLGVLLQFQQTISVGAAAHLHVTCWQVGKAAEPCRSGGELAVMCCASAGVTPLLRTVPAACRLADSWQCCSAAPQATLRGHCRLGWAGTCCSAILQVPSCHWQGWLP